MLNWLVWSDNYKIISESAVFTHIYIHYVHVMCIHYVHRHGMNSLRYYYVYPRTLEHVSIYDRFPRLLCLFNVLSLFDIFEKAHGIHISIIQQTSNDSTSLILLIKVEVCVAYLCTVQVTTQKARIIKWISDCTMHIVSLTTSIELEPQFIKYPFHYFTYSLIYSLTSLFWN